MTDPTTTASPAGAVPSNPIASARARVAEYERRARAGEFGPPPDPPPPWLGTVDDIERDAELARVHRSIIDPYQAARFFMQHAAAITRHGERRRYFER